MANFRKILLFSFLFSLSVGLYASDSVYMNDLSYNDTKNEKEAIIPTMTLTVTINSNATTKIKNVPTKGYFEVYSILGKREKRLKLDNCQGEISIELPKGLYILKAEKVTQKIIVK